MDTENMFVVVNDEAWGELNDAELQVWDADGTDEAYATGNPAEFERITHMVSLREVIEFYLKHNQIPKNNHYGEE
jgi:hypothetical protein